MPGKGGVDSGFTKRPAVAAHFPDRPAQQCVVEQTVFGPLAGVIRDKHGRVEIRTDALHLQELLIAARGQTGAAVELFDEDVGHRPVGVGDQELRAARGRRSADRGIDVRRQQPAHSPVLVGVLAAHVCTNGNAGGALHIGRNENLHQPYPLAQESDWVFYSAGGKDLQGAPVSPAAAHAPWSSHALSFARALRSIREM